MTTISKFIIQKYHIKPTKRLGQNFLIDRKILKKIIKAAELKKDDIVLEVGPGLGILTFELAKYVKKVIGVEKDQKMVEYIKNALIKKNIENVKVIHADILKLEIKKLTFYSKSKIKNWKVVANIPYYLTSALIRKFLESDYQPTLLVLMLQKEVAQRICAKPPKMALLSVAVQFYAKPEIISYVSKKSFWPVPKVDSAIVKIKPFVHCLEGDSKPPNLLRHVQVDKKFIRRFFVIVHAGFAHPRKKIINNLSPGLKIPRKKMEKILLKARISPSQRPSELSVDMWITLCGLLEEKKL